MGRARRLPDAETLLRLRGQGLTPAAIAGRYGATEEGVRRALDRADAHRGRGASRDLVPWIIAPEHRSTAVMGHFRTIGKQRAGAEPHASELRFLQRWMAWLDERDVVVNYHPEAPPNPASRAGGFYYMARRPDDEWIIRRPVTGIPDEPPANGRARGAPETPPNN